jgi:hypothetical protein
LELHCYGYFTQSFMIYTELCVPLQFAFRKKVVVVTWQAMIMLKAELFPVPHPKQPKSL